VPYALNLNQVSPDLLNNELVTMNGSRGLI
jgi:hypothetical protein